MYLSIGVGTWVRLFDMAGVCVGMNWLGLGASSRARAEHVSSQADNYVGIMKGEKGS
jgi:hypothetical protein